MSKLKKEGKYLYYNNPKKINLKYYIKNFFYIIERLYYNFLIRILKAPEKNSYKYKVSICAIFKDEADYIKEWIEFHRIVGVEHFYLYDNNSSDNYMEVLSPYISEGIVSIKTWIKPQSQMEAYEDFMTNKASETLWVGFIDLDEYVIPNITDDIYSFLKNFNNRPSVVIYWKYFGTSGFIDRDRQGLLTEDFVNSWSKFEDLGKFFFNTKYNYSPNYKRNNFMHCTWGKCKGIHLPPVNVFDQISTAEYNHISSGELPIQINHYVIKSLNEYITKKAKRGGGVHPLGVHNLDYFYYHENRCQSCDYHAYKYLIKLKLAMGENDYNI